MSRLTARETPLDLVTLDRSPVVGSLAQRHETTHVLPPRTGEFAKVGEASMREDCVGRDASLDAARGIAIGLALGMLCWLLVAALVYLIVR